MSKSVPASMARKALAGISLALLLSSLGTSIANIALPTLAQIFGLSLQEVQWVVLSYLLSITILIVTMGRLGDILGRKFFLLTGIAVFTVASVLCGSAPAVSWLIVARAVQGLGAAIMMSQTLALVGELVPKEKTGGAMGLMGSMSAIGTALGPSLGGLLISAIGWRAIFFVNIPLGILALFLVYRYVPSQVKKDPLRLQGIDYAGTVILAVTLAAYTLAMTIGQGHFGMINIVLLFLFSCGAGLFIFFEKKASAPLIHMDLFHHKVLGAGFATSFLVSTVLMATLVVGPFYLSGALGLKPFIVGIIMSVGPIFVAAAGIPAGRLVDVFGAQRVTMCGLISMVAGCAFLAVLPALFSIPGYVLPVIVLTCGYAFFQTANNTSVMLNIEQDQRGVVSGMLNLSRNLGLITGVSVMGAVFTAAAGTVKIFAAAPEEIASGMHVTFAVGAAIIGVATWINHVPRVVSKNPVIP